MRNIVILSLFFSGCLFCNAQKKLNISELKEDFEIFERILKNGHPSLYAFVSKDSLDHLFSDISESFTEKQTDTVLFKNMLRVTNTIKDSNLQIALSQHNKTSPYYFPLILKIIASELYTDTKKFDIPIGSKIISINGINSKKIISDLKKYVSADGHSRARLFREIESKFSIYLRYEYGLQKKFNVDFISPNGEHKSIELLAESLHKIKQSAFERNTFFAKFHDQKGGFDFFNTYINTKTPFIKLYENLSTAILVINSFDINPSTFKSKLNQIFTTLHHKKTQHLIVDVRQNSGGFRSNAITLYSFLSATPFKQISSTYVTSLSVPEKQFAKNIHLNEKEYLKNRFYRFPVYDGWKINFDDLESIMFPNRNRFLGKIYVLTSGKTFSNAAAFALNAKNDPDITVLGEESGTGYYFYNNDYPVYYELPNSKIQLTLCMYNINTHVVDDSIPFGNAIPVDKKICLLYTSPSPRDA